MRRILLRSFQRYLVGGPWLFPDYCHEIVAAFADLHAARRTTFAGPQPIAYSEIAAYIAVMRKPFSPAHVALVRALDAAWLKHVQGAPAAPAGPRSAINAAAFDAVFA